MLLKQDLELLCDLIRFRERERIAFDESLKLLHKCNAELMRSFEPEEKQQILSVLTPEERLSGLTPEERLAGLTPEQREQRKHLRAVAPCPLERRQSARAAPSSRGRTSVKPSPSPIKPAGTRWKAAPPDRRAADSPPDHAASSRGALSGSPSSDLG